MNTWDAAKELIESYERVREGDVALGRHIDSLALWLIGISLITIAGGWYARGLIFRWIIGTFAIYPTALGFLCLGIVPMAGVVFRVIIYYYLRDTREYYHTISIKVHEFYKLPKHDQDRIVKNDMFIADNAIQSTLSMLKRSLEYAGRFGYTLVILFSIGYSLILVGAVFVGIHIFAEQYGLKFGNLQLWISGLIWLGSLVIVGCSALIAIWLGQRLFEKLEKDRILKVLND